MNINNSQIVIKDELTNKKRMVINGTPTSNTTCGISFYGENGSSEVASFYIHDMGSNISESYLQCNNFLTYGGGYFTFDSGIEADYFDGKVVNHEGRQGRPILSANDSVMHCNLIQCRLENGSKVMRVWGSWGTADANTTMDFNPSSSD